MHVDVEEKFREHPSSAAGPMRAVSVIRRHAASRSRSSQSASVHVPWTERGVRKPRLSSVAETLFGDEEALIRSTSSTSSTSPSHVSQERLGYVGYEGLSELNEKPPWSVLGDLVRRDREGAPTCSHPAPGDRGRHPHRLAGFGLTSSTVLIMTSNVRRTS